MCVSDGECDYCYFLWDYDDSCYSCSFCSSCEHLVGRRREEEEEEMGVEYLLSGSGSSTYLTLVRGLDIIL